MLSNDVIALLSKGAGREPRRHGFAIDPFRGVYVKISILGSFEIEIAVPTTE